MTLPQGLYGPDMGIGPCAAAREHQTHGHTGEEPCHAGIVIVSLVPDVEQLGHRQTVEPGFGARWQQAVSRLDQDQVDEALPQEGLGQKGWNAVFGSPRALGHQEQPVYLTANDIFPIDLVGFGDIEDEVVALLGG